MLTINFVSTFKDDPLTRPNTICSNGCLPGGSEKAQIGSKDFVTYNLHEEYISRMNVYSKLKKP